jgi:hypothetical protein
VKELKTVKKEVSNPVEEIKEVINERVEEKPTVKFVEVENKVKVN